MLEFLFGAVVGWLLASSEECPPPQKPVRRYYVPPSTATAATTPILATSVEVVADSTMTACGYPELGTYGKCR